MTWLSCKKSYHSNSIDDEKGFCQFFTQKIQAILHSKLSNLFLSIEIVWKVIQIGKYHRIWSKLLQENLIRHHRKKFQKTVAFTCFFFFQEIGSCGLCLGHCFTHAKISFCNRKLGAEMRASTLEIEGPFETQEFIIC